MKVLNPAISEKEETDKRFRLLKYKVNEHVIEKIWKQFAEAGFEPILIKGWAASRMYSDPSVRYFSDVDLMVAPDRYQDALKFAENVRERLPVDLHKGARHLDTLGFEELFAHTIKEKCNETEIRILRREDHLRLLCIHWLTDGGEYKEKLWDIFYGLANRPENFDWDRFLNITTARRRRWLVCTIGLAHKYLGLDIENTPISSEAKNLPHWLIKTVEREWASKVRMLPLDMFLNNRKMFWKQIKKRIPPNPIQATVLEEGDFDKYPRIGYQIKNMFHRALPLTKSIRKKISARRHNL
jgi:hypothetical protein